VKVFPPGWHTFWDYPVRKRASRSRPGARRTGRRLPRPRPRGERATREPPRTQHRQEPHHGANAGRHRHL